MTLIDGDRIITAQLYDDEHEEFIEKKMSIIDYVNAYTDEGVTTADDVLDKIRGEIEQFAKNPNFGDLSTGASCGAVKAIEIINKYMSEGSEE